MISINRYKIMVDLINNAQNRGSEVTRYVLSINTTLSNSEILADSVDKQRLIDQIDVTLDVMTRYHELYSGYMTDFVLALQNYIDDNYSSVNDFLLNNNIQVLPVFADISRVVGYPIDSVNIYGNVS